MVGCSCTRGQQDMQGKIVSGVGGGGDAKVAKAIQQVHEEEVAVHPI